MPALACCVAGWAAILWVPPFSDDSVNDLYVYRTFAEPVLRRRAPLPRRSSSSTRRWPRRRSCCRGCSAPGEEAFRWAFAGWTLLLAAAVVVLCGALAARTGGDRRRALLAAAAMPLLCGAMLRTHFDLAPVALMLLALWLVVAERPRLGLAVLGLAVMTKGFPLVAAPAGPRLARRARRPARGPRGRRWRWPATIAVVAAFAHRRLRGRLPRLGQLPGRPPGAGGEHAGRLRATRWTASGLGEAEGWAATAPTAWSTRPPTPWRTLLAAAMLARGRPALAPGRRPARTTRRAVVLAALGAVAAFACLGRVLSPQYLVWTVPLGRARVRLAPATRWRWSVALADRAHADRVPRPLPRARGPRAVPGGAGVPPRRRAARGGGAGRARATAARGGAAARCAWRGPPPSASTSTAFSQGSSSEVSKRTLVSVRKRSIACSRLTPITPPRGPVMPTSVT